MSALTMILVRHGQTVANLEGIVQGHGDTPLTKEGVESIISKAKRLASLKIDAVYCSDLGRATRTYEILKENIKSLPEACFTSALREIDFGDYTLDRREELMPIIMEYKANPDQRYPNGECGADLKSRVCNFNDEILARHKDQTLLVISHYGIMETLVRLHTNHPSNQPVLIQSDDVLQMKFNSNGNVSLTSI